MSKQLPCHSRYIYKCVTKIKKLVDVGTISPRFKIGEVEDNLEYRYKPTKRQLARALNKDLRLVQHGDGTYSFKEEN